MSLTERQQKLGELRSKATEALNEIRANTDDSRVTELEQRHDAIMAEFDTEMAAFEREQRAAEAEQRANRLLGDAEQRAREARRPGGSGETSAEDRGDSGNVTHREAFHAWLKARGEMSELSSEQRSVLEQRAQSTTSSAGGYMIPVEMANVLDKTLAMWGPMYDEAICTVITTPSGNQITIPTVDDTSGAMAKHTEATALTDDGGVDVTFGQKTLDAYAYDTEWIRFSYELVQDSMFNVEQTLGELLGERIARRVNTELTTGDGTGDPNGIVTASSLGKTAAATGAITPDELVDLLHSVNPAYRASPKARWMFNDTTLAAIRKLKDGDGTYIWQMGDIRSGEPGTLLGYGYSVNQAMASIATGNKVALFGDFSKYWVRKVGGPVLGIRRETYWPDLGIAGIVRVDGELLQSTAVKHLIMA